jgi:hypothetical protein
VGQLSVQIKRLSGSVLGANQQSGTVLIKSALGDYAFASIYKGKRFIAKDLEFANARRMWKF